VYRVLVRECDHWGDLGIDWWIILRWIFRRWDVAGMGWIELAWDRDKWWAVVNAVMNLQIPETAGNFLTSCNLVSFSRTLLHGVSNRNGYKIWRYEYLPKEV
jgi:hypothetical protein